MFWRRIEVSARKNMENLRARIVCLSSRFSNYTTSRCKIAWAMFTGKNSNTQHWTKMNIKWIIPVVACDVVNVASRVARNVFVVKSSSTPLVRSLKRVKRIEWNFFTCHPIPMHRVYRSIWNTTIHGSIFPGTPAALSKLTESHTRKAKVSESRRINAEPRAVCHWLVPVRIKIEHRIVSSIG